MPQYNIGTVIVTQGSNQVQGSAEVDWSFVVEGDLFTKTGTTLVYTIGACNPTTKVITLIENYVGIGEAGMAYEISTEFSPAKNLPLPSPKDTNAVAIIRRALLAIDAFDTGYAYYAYASDDQGTGFTVTFDPALDYFAFLKSAVEIPTPQASDFAGLWKNVRGPQGIQGIQGQVGPAWDQWLGPWVTATGYIIKDAVSNLGSSYICKSAHTSGSISEPGTGTNWQSYWDVIAEKGTASAADISGAIHAAPSKTTLVDADEFGVTDSAASFGLKKITWANITAAQMISITRDMTAASGNVAYTGVGFKPKCLISHAARDANSATSHGMSTGTTESCVAKQGEAATVQNVFSTIFIFIATDAAGTNYQYASVVSVEADGFTLGWVKGGSPAGTLTANITALK